MDNNSLKINNLQIGGYFNLKGYIKELENPNRVGWNGKIWTAPTLKGYDKNLRGYGIDINTNKAARKLTEGRPGRWLTEDEADTLMDDHINYITEAANKHIKGFSELPFRRKWALLGMLYRGDSVNKSGININEPDDLKFFKSISDYYRSKGLNARANSSDEFFNRPVSKLLSMFKLKQGGKMNILEFLKNGSGIHIKKENKGKFTDYCGGKVTSECIAKGKRSPNAAIRKRATFASNARKWKHLKGGIIKAADGTKTNFFGKIGNFLNSDLGKTIVSGVSEIVKGVKSSSDTANFITEDNKRIQKGKQAILNNIDMSSVLLEANNNIAQRAAQDSNVHFGEIDLLQEILRLINLRRAQNSSQANLWEQEQIANLNLQVQTILGSGTSSILDSLGGIATGIINKFSSSNNKNGNPSSSFFENPYLKTLNKAGTINSDGSMNTGIGGLTYNWNTNLFGNNNNILSFPLFLEGMTLMNDGTWVHKSLVNNYIKNMKPYGGTNVNNWSPSERRSSGYGAYYLG